MKTAKLPTIFSEKEIYIKSSLGIKIKILNIGWQNIVTKHPELKSAFNELIETLTKSKTIRKSKIDNKIYLYYYKIKDKKYLCAVCRHYNGKGFLITAYYTYKLQGKKYE